MTDNALSSPAYDPAGDPPDVRDEPRAGRQPSSFDPTPHIRRLRGRGGDNEYLDVKWSLVWLRREHPDARIITDHVQIDPTMAIFRASVSIPGGGEATGYGSETAADFGDYIEKAETKAIGRALRALGYGAPYNEADDEPEAGSWPGRGAPARGNRAPNRSGSDRGGDRVPDRANRPAAAPPAASTPPAAYSANEIREAGPNRASPRPDAAPERAAARPDAMGERGAPRPDSAPERVARTESAGAASSARPPLAGAGRGAADAQSDELNARPGPERDRAAMGDRPGQLAERGPAADRAATAGPVADRPARGRPAPSRDREIPAGGNAPGAAGTVAADDVDLADFSWSSFWPWARSIGLADKAAVEALIGHPITGAQPGRVRAEVLAARGEG